MPFIACISDTGERVDITRLQQPRAFLQGKVIECQLCAAPMIVKAGAVVRAHFAHKAGMCASDYLAHPESAAHLLGKTMIAERLRVELSDYAGAVIEYEVPIPEVRRVADVLVTFPNGWRVAHECQLAGISPEELTARSDDYLAAGIDVVWWLGKRADAPINRAWCVVHQTPQLVLTFTGADSEPVGTIWHQSWETQQMEPYTSGAELLHHIQYYDVRRSFEIWERLTYHELLRGLGIKQSRSNHWVGVVGSLNGKAIAKQREHGADVWVVVNRAAIPYRSWHTHYRLLSADAIETAKRVARSLRNHQPQALNVHTCPVPPRTHARTHAGWPATTPPRKEPRHDDRHAPTL